MTRHDIFRPTLTLALALALVGVSACLGAAGAAWASGKAHEHGAMKLDVAVDGNTLVIALETPLDNLLGFERAPRNDAERKAAADVLARLRGPDMAAPLWSADAAAQCSLSLAEVKAPVLEPVAGSPAPKGGHADLDARYEYRCAQPAALRQLDVALFDAYRRIKRIDVQVAGPQGQAKLTLRRPARSVPLVR
ncbi:MAG: DUF2796 domain-containing protein [Rubrivivax sp.]|jgi:hypothetical protein|nr:DUF2796 domain-containing protein [Rubrivivax sp.]